MTAETYHVMAQVNGKGTLWVNVLTTASYDYALATRDEFEDADVPVRVDTTINGRKVTKEKRK
jgi:hypothetical protein